jgi:hypothetical protein
MCGLSSATVVHAASRSACSAFRATALAGFHCKLRMLAELGAGDDGGCGARFRRVGFRRGICTGLDRLKRLITNIATGQTTPMSRMYTLPKTSTRCSTVENPGCELKAAPAAQTPMLLRIATVARNVMGLIAGRISNHYPHHRHSIAAIGWLARCLPLNRKSSIFRLWIR